MLGACALGARSPAALEQTGALAEGFCCSILPSSQGGAKELSGE